MSLTVSQLASLQPARMLPTLEINHLLLVYTWSQSVFLCFLVPRFPEAHLSLNLRFLNCPAIQGLQSYCKANFKKNARGLKQSLFFFDDT